MRRTLWKKVEPLLSWAGHLDLLIGRTGLGGLIFTGASGIVTAILAWMHAVPPYVVVLAGMFGMGAALFIANQSLKLITAWKAHASVSGQQAGQLERKDPGGVHLGGSTAVVITLLASAIIIVGGLYASGRYSTWRDNLENTFIYPMFKGIHPYEAPTDIGFGIDIVEVNNGNLPIQNIAIHYTFKYPKTTMEAPQEDEDTVMRSVVAGLPITTKVSATLYPHTDGQWFTANDPNMTKELWDDFIANKRSIYLFLAMRYSVSGYTRITELCYFVRANEKGAKRLCEGHNRSYWVQ